MLRIQDTKMWGDLSYRTFIQINCLNEQTFELGKFWHSRTLQEKTVQDIQKLLQVDKLGILTPGFN